MSKSSDSAPPTFFYLGKETNTKQNNKCKLFDGKPKDEAYFGDYVHYLPRGRDVIAPEIAKTIGPSIDDQIKNSLRLSECLSKP